MNYDHLYARFLKIRSEQVASFGKEVVTKIDEQVSEVMFKATCNAMSNVATGENKVYMQAVSLGTGMGKTTAACAMLAAAALSDQNFSGAYVVPTARIGEEVKQMIEASLGRDTVYLWTSYHDKNSRIEANRIIEAVGHLPVNKTTKNGLPMARIVIVTHETLKNEAKYDHDYGVTTYLGKSRNVVFIDESPSVLDVYHSTPEELQGLHDKCNARDDLRYALPIIASVVAKMSAVMQLEGHNYLAVDLISPEEAKALEKITSDEIWTLTDEELSNELRCSEGNAIRSLMMFLKAASHGNVFYSKKDGTFFSYLMHLCKSYPGYVLLDATSDLEGLIKLDSGVHSLAVPTPSYEDLEIFSLDMPHRLNNKGNVAKSRELARCYAQYIRDTVCSNAGEHDEVLIVLPKFLLDQELISAADDPEQPEIWSGIRINTQHWGAGVGSNKFRHKTHVFMFGDYVLPRSVTIARAHAWSGMALDNAALRDAVSRRAAGMRYRPKGMYSGCHDGFILRWAKQLAMRGTARQINGDGKAAPMKLFTTMSRYLLTQTYSQIFPGAPFPKPANVGLHADRDEEKGRKGLESLLFKGGQAYYAAEEIAIATSIPSHRLGREYNAIECRVKEAGWELCAAKLLGKPGRSKYLVNWTRIQEKLQPTDIAKLH